MKWTDAYNLLMGFESHQAMLLSMAWGCAAEWKDSALLSNLLCNMLKPYDVCYRLDCAGVPIPPEAIPSLPVNAGTM